MILFYPHILFPIAEKYIHFILQDYVKVIQYIKFFHKYNFTGLYITCLFHL